MKYISSASAIFLAYTIFVMVLIMPAYAFLPETSLSEADGSFLGEFTGDYAGCSIASGGDVNGDGFDDILIGAKENDKSAIKAGQVYLVLGKEAGWTMDAGMASASEGSFLGERSAHRAGASVAIAGDVNGDGFDDILIGAPYYDAGT